jgi:hypothetical protein
MGIDRRQWTARTPGPTGLRARIEQVAELVEPVELPPPAAEPEAEAEAEVGETPEPETPAAEPQPGSGILADVPHWRTNPAAFATRLDATAEDEADAEAEPAAADGDGGEPADPPVDAA